MCLLAWIVLFITFASLAESGSISCSCGYNAGARGGLGTGTLLPAVRIADVRSAADQSGSSRVAESCGSLWVKRGGLWVQVQLLLSKFCVRNPSALFPLSIANTTSACKDSSRGACCRLQIKLSDLIRDNGLRQT